MVDKNKPLSEKKMKEYELFTKDKKVFYWGKDIAQAIKDLKEELNNQMEKERKDWKDRKIYQGEYGEGWITSRKYVRKSCLKIINKHFGEFKDE